jgi:hypothetical protein
MPCGPSLALLAKPAPVPATATPAAVRIAATVDPALPSRRGQAGQAQRRDGQPGEEHDPGDRQVRQVGVEDP